MNYENKLFDLEENKSENENRILPTDNFHFSTNKKSKNKIKYTLNNKIESKKSYKDFIKAKNNNTQNLFSNVVLKELLAKNLINNELKSSIIQNNNYLENNNKTKQEKKNSHILSIKRNSLKFIKENKKISSIDKDIDKKINIYNCLQKRLINDNNRKSKRIKDNKFNSHSISINNENKNINVTIFPEKVNIKEENYIYKNKINKIINKNINEISDVFQKISYPSSKNNSLNILNIKNTNINQTRYMNNAFLTPKSSYSKKNIFYNENIKQMNEDNNRIILKELNNLKKLNLKEKQNNKKLNNFNINHQSKFHKTFNLVNIENYKNKLFSNHNKRPPLFLEYGDILQKKNNKSLSLNENKIEKNKYKRIKSSYIRHNKPEFGYINSLSQKKLVDNKYNDIPNNRIKESIFSNILSNVEENESFNNNIVCQLYKRPQINILTLLELKGK